MIDKSYNIFEAATQLISLDCSSITGETSFFCNKTTHSLQQSILNLKTVLPTFTAQFKLFKEEIIEMSYFIVNKLTSVIKAKSLAIQELENDLDKSHNLNNDMKQQVIQLQKMIIEFMDSFKKELQQKDKEIIQKQKEVDELKNVLKQNFNSPRNLCKNCEQKINHTDRQNLITETIEETKEPKDFHLKISNLIKNYERNEEMLIEMSESILCNTEEITRKKSLEIIQEQNSDVNSLTDYLQSQRCSQKENTCQSIGQLIRSTRSGEEKQQKVDQLCGRKLSTFDDRKNLHCDKAQSLQQLSDEDKTVKDQNSPVGKINFFQNLQTKNFNDTFSSRITHKNYNENTKIQNERQRRNSQHIFPSKDSYEGFKIERKSQERTVLGNKIIENQIHPTDNIKDTFNLKAQLQQISKSSSCSDINHLGDSQKFHVNLPKKFQTPKNMNFLKKNPNQDQRLRTQPSPPHSIEECDKENVKIEYQPKANEMGRKIIARKKMIMTHAKASTSRIETKKQFKQPNEEFLNQQKQSDFSKKKENFIEIKFIESPEKQSIKQSHLVQLPKATIFSSKPSEENGSRKNNYIDYFSTASNISAINQSSVKSHHMYHSTGKYLSEETSKNIHKITMTPGKPQSKDAERKSMSKSKEKLKVMSKSVNQDQSIFQGKYQQEKDRASTETSHNFFLSCNNHSISKLKNKSISVHIGSSGNKKFHLKQILSEIKNALKNYRLNSILSSLREAYFDGKLVNGLKQGPGKLVYENGIIYEGTFRAGKKEGEAKLCLNGVDIFEGIFINDEIESQGYLKFFKYFSNLISSCPKVLQNASYYGRFSGSIFDGMGTLFLNQKEKIVTKFEKGVPFGQLTFYTENDIQFGHWPTD